MPHYHIEGLECQWTLVRETPTSQVLRCTVDGVEVGVDVHYTPAKILTVSLVVVGTEPSKGLLTPVLDDVSKMALRRGDYAVIDYTLSSTSRLSEGNYSVDKESREIFRTTM